MSLPPHPRHLLISESTNRNRQTDTHTHTYTLIKIHKTSRQYKPNQQDLKKMPQTNLFLAAELFEFLMCLCINSLSDVCLANFQHVNCLSPQSVVQRLFGLLLPRSSIYAFIVCAFGSIPKYFRQDQCQEVFPTCFLRVIFHLLFFH